MILALPARCASLTTAVSRVVRAAGSWARALIDGKPLRPEGPSSSQPGPPFVDTEATWKSF